MFSLTPPNEFSSVVLLYRLLLLLRGSLASQNKQAGTLTNQSPDPVFSLQNYEL